MGKFKGMEIMYELAEGSILICYSQFDLGMKYKLYKNSMYVNAFDSGLHALDYAKKML